MERASWALPSDHTAVAPAHDASRTTPQVCGEAVAAYPDHSANVRGVDAVAYDVAAVTQTLEHSTVDIERLRCINEQQHPLLARLPPRAQCDGVRAATRAVLAPTPHRTIATAQCATAPVRIALGGPWTADVTAAKHRLEFSVPARTVREHDPALSAKTAPEIGAPFSDSDAWQCTSGPILALGRDGHVVSPRAIERRIAPEGDHMATTRALVAGMLAAATFGGTVGALATAAVQSQASPEAVAAAVQKVQDQTADRTLSTISSKLGAMKSTLSAIESHMVIVDRALSSTINSPLYRIQDQLFDICLNTNGGGTVPVACPTPLIEPGISRDRH